MLEPQLVAACVKAMQAVCSIPVTVKTRTGIVLRDAPDAYSNLDFLMRLVDTLVDRLSATLPARASCCSWEDCRLLKTATFRP